MDVRWGRGSNDRELPGLPGAVVEGWGLREGWAGGCQPGWAVPAGQVGAAVLAHALCSFIFHASFSGLPDL